MPLLGEQRYLAVYCQAWAGPMSKAMPPLGFFGSILQTMIVRSEGWPSMSRIERVSIERRSWQGSVREWTDSLITCVAREPLSWWDQELTSCVPIGEHNFGGNIEFGTLATVVWQG